MTPLLLLSAVLLAAGPEVTVSTLAGERIAGTVVEFQPAAVVVQTPAGDTTLGYDTLLSLAVSERANAVREPAAIAVRLIDGSTLSASSYVTTGSKATVKLSGGKSVELSTKAIQWVRFVDPAQAEDKLAQQWGEIVDSKSHADLIVVRKQGAIDFLEGVLQDVDAEVVKFELDKEVIPVKRFKVEGFVYYHAAGEPLAEAICELTDIYGSRLVVKEMSLAGDSLKLSVPAGFSFEMPVNTVANMDFSRGKIQFLSDLQPAVVKYESYFGFKNDVKSVIDMSRPAREAGMESNPLKLGGKQYNKGIALRSQTLVEYRLPAKFRTFKALVGIDDNVNEGGNALVVIKGDSRLLWTGKVLGGAPAQALDLDIEGVKRLEILVDYGDDLDVGDHVDFCDARVVK